MAYEDNQIEKASGRALMDHQPPSVTEKLEQERRELELRLKAINEVLDQLNANPETAEIIDSLAKLGRGMF
jgi:chaperonin cofactor prefoldin